MEYLGYSRVNSPFPFYALASVEIVTKFAIFIYISLNFPLWRTISQRKKNSTVLMPQIKSPNNPIFCCSLSTFLLGNESASSSDTWPPLFSHFFLLLNALKLWKSQLIRKIPLWVLAEWLDLWDLSRRYFCSLWSIAGIWVSVLTTVPPRSDLWW